MYTLTDSYYFCRVFSEARATYQCPLIWMEKKKSFKLDESLTYSNRSKWMRGFSFLIAAVISLFIFVAKTVKLEIYVVFLCFLWFGLLMNFILDFITFHKRAAYVQILNSNLSFLKTCQGKLVFVIPHLSSYDADTLLIINLF